MSMKTHYKKILLVSGFLCAGLNLNAQPPADTQTSMAPAQHNSIKTIASFEEILKDGVNPGDLVLLDWDNCICTTEGPVGSYEESVFNAIQLFQKELHKQCTTNKDLSTLLGTLEKEAQQEAQRTGKRPSASDIAKMTLAKLKAQMPDLANTLYAKAFMGSYLIFVQGQKEASIALTHSGVKDLFKHLEQHSIPHILFTSRSSSEAELTFSQLEKLGLALTHPVENLTLNTPIPSAPGMEVHMQPVYDPRGALFCGALVPKATLAEMLADVFKMHLSPSGRIVYADDSLEHIEKVSELFNKKNIPNQCYHFNFKRDWGFTASSQ